MGNSGNQENLSRSSEQPKRYRLAEIIIITTSFTLPEQDCQTFGHVNPQEFIEVRKGGGEGGQCNDLGDRERGQMLPSESCDLKIELDYKRPI
jgi:hypothetical protein